MRPEQMTPIVRAELERLSPAAQKSLRAWLDSQVQIMAGVGSDPVIRYPSLLQVLSERRQRCAEITMEQFDEMFPDATRTEHNAHLGARRIGE